MDFKFLFRFLGEKIKLKKLEQKIRILFYEGSKLELYSALKLIQANCQNFDERES